MCFRAAIVVAVIGVVGLAAGAVQLFPSIEYSTRSLRFLGAPGALPADQKIPYADMFDQNLPQGIALLVVPFAFNGNAGLGETTSPYIGVFPFLAAVIGIRRYWRYLWVRYLAGLAVASFLFSIGTYSWLHGVLYAIVPKLWNMREASRMVYVEDFALVILAAYGVEALVVRGSAGGDEGCLERVSVGRVEPYASRHRHRVRRRFVGPRHIREARYQSLERAFDTDNIRVLRSVPVPGSRESRRRSADRHGFLILFDLSACDWTAQNRIEVAKTGVDQLDRILSARGAAQFLKAQADPFRVRIQADAIPNIGDLFGVPMVDPAGGATLPIDFERIRGYTDLLNVRFTLTPANEQKPGDRVSGQGLEGVRKPERLSARMDRARNHSRAFRGRAAARLGTPGFDARRTALTVVPVAVEPLAEGARETAQARRRAQSNGIGGGCPKPRPSDPERKLLPRMARDHRWPNRAHLPRG